MAYNILIVDDSSTIRAVLVKILKMTKRDIGQIHEAADGREALVILQNNWVDLVLSDINMPVMSGVELINVMSRDPLLRDIPVVVISTDGSSARIEDLKKKGVKEYIRKPFTPETIGGIIDKIMGVTDEKS